MMECAAVGHAAAAHVQVVAVPLPAPAAVPPAPAGAVVTQFQWPNASRPVRVVWWLPGFLRQWLSVS